MRKRVCLLVVLCLVLLSGTAFAANWTFAAEDFYGKVSVDRDTVFRDADILTFWALQVISMPLLDDRAKELRKYEVKLTSPRQYRVLEQYYLKADGTETSREPKPEEKWAVVGKGSFYDKVIDTAIKYAQDGKDPGQKPTP